MEITKFRQLVVYQAKPFHHPEKVQKLNSLTLHWSHGALFRIASTLILQSYLSGKCQYYLRHCCLLCAMFF